MLLLYPAPPPTQKRSGDVTGWMSGNAHAAQAKAFAP